MVRGRKTKVSGASSERAISGHLDDWTELAVDYVDGRVEPSTEAAILEHLAGCTDCARRLEAQRPVVALFAQNPLADAPQQLQTKVLETLLVAGKPAREARRLTRRRVAHRPYSMFGPSGPWLPAAAGAAAVLALVLALTVSRNPVGLDERLTSTTAMLAAESESSQTLRDAPVAFSSTTASVLLGSGDPATDSSEAPAELAGTAASSAAALQSAGPLVSDEGAMISGLANADASAYFFFNNTDGGLASADQADSVVSRLTAATGLRLMDRGLTSGVRAFAAFVPRDDSEAVVILLCSIGSSLKLDVCLSLEPGTEVVSWADTMLQDKYSLAELSASPSKPPATSGWLYTTSTAPTSTSDGAKAPKPTLLSEAGTHVLVVIYLATP